MPGAEGGGGGCLRPIAPSGKALRLPGRDNLRINLRSLVRLAGVVLLLAAACNVEARIPRDRAEVRAFRSEHVCPATGQHRGGCPGFHVDHIIPLCAGGPDKRANMQWISKEDHRFKTYVDVRECRKARAQLKFSDGLDTP